MSNDEKKSGLSNFLGQLQEGVSRLNNKRPEREKDPSIDERASPDDSLLQSQDHGPSPDDDRDDGPLLIDAEPDKAEVSSKTKGPMSKKKGMLLIGVLAVAAVLYQNLGKSPELPPEVEVAAEPEVESSRATAPDDFNPLGIPGGLDAGSPSLDEAVGQTLTDLHLNGPLQISPSSKPPMETPNSGFENDPFARQGMPGKPAPTPSSLPVADVSPFDLAADAPANPFGIADQTPQASPEPSTNAAAAPEKGDAILARAASDNPDSKQLPSLQETGETEVAELKAKLALQEKAIADLNAKLKDLAPKASPATNSVKAPASPKKAPVAEQRRAVAKAEPRPKICVKAVAPPARNCSTCVAHAFLVNANHEEDMVGQGDYIAGYRVSITGDRLDLQNSAGKVVHKFWSQPNGCPSI